MTAEKPLIVAFVDDLMFASKIDNVARGLDFRVEWVEQAEKFGPADKTDLPGEPVSGGQATNLMRYLSESQPSLLLFDLHNEKVPWQRWIPILKSSPATRRIPLLAYAAHVDEQRLAEGERVGADVVVNRGKFAARLPQLIAKHARRHDRDAAQSACEEPLHPLAVEGIRLFNAGAYFDAHEELEHAWNADQGAGRDLYRAVLQIAVAYLQIERGNYRGAAKMFLRVRQWLEPLPAQCRGIDVAQLQADAERVYAQLLELGPERIAEFDVSAFAAVPMIADG